MPKITSDVRLYVKINDNAGFGSPYLTADAEVCTVNEDGELRNILYERFGDTSDVAGYDSLTVHAQCDASEGRWYGWSVEYRQPYSVDLERLESMVKTLRRVNARLAALEAKFGYPDTFAAYLARVADAVGARHPKPFITNEAEPHARRADWRWHDVQSIGYALDRGVTQFRKAHGISSEAA